MSGPASTRSGCDRPADTVTVRVAGPSAGPGPGAADRRARLAVFWIFGLCGVICSLGPAARATTPYLVDLIAAWPGDMDMQGSASEALCAIGPETSRALEDHGRTLPTDAHTPARAILSECPRRSS